MQSICKGKDVPGYFSLGDTLTLFGKIKELIQTHNASDGIFAVSLNYKCNDIVSSSKSVASRNSYLVAFSPWILLFLEEITKRSTPKPAQTGRFFKLSVPPIWIYIPSDAQLSPPSFGIFKSVC